MTTRTARQPASILLSRMLRTALAFTLAVVATAAAQSGVGLSPPRADLQTVGAGQLNQTVQIDNPSRADALAVNVSINDVLLQPDGSALYLPPESHPGSLAGWLSVTPLSFELAPGASEEVNYTLQVPHGTLDGTYWSILFFESQAPGSDEPGQGIGVQTRVRVGHVIYVDVGQVSRAGEIEGFRYQSPGEEPTSSIQVMFRNTGTGLIRATGHVELRNPDGELVHTLEVPPTATFPGHASEIRALLPEPLATGEYLVLAVLDYGQASLVTGEGWLEVQ